MGRDHTYLCRPPCHTIRHEHKIATLNTWINVKRILDLRCKRTTAETPSLAPDALFEWELTEVNDREFRLDITELVYSLIKA